MLSAPRPGRGPRVPFSSDADLYALDLDSGSSDAEKDRHGSASLGKGGSFPRAGSATPGLSDHLYDTLVRQPVLACPPAPAASLLAPPNVWRAGAEVVTSFLHSELAVSNHS